MIILKKGQKTNMAYTYTPSNTSSKQKMNLSVWSMQVTSAINTIIDLFANTFLVSFIVQTNADEPISKALTSISLFYIATYAMMLVVNILLSYLVDRTDRVWVYRLGLVLKAVFIVLVIFLGQDLAKLSVVAGALMGIAEGCYWASYNVLKGEMVPRAHANKFSAVSLFLEKIIKIVFPILIGFLIDVSTYSSVACYVLIIVAIQIIFSFFIKSKRPENSSFKLFAYLKKLQKKDEDIKRIKRFYPLIFGNACTTLMSSLVTLLTVYTFKTNLNLGLFTALSAFSSILLLGVFKRFTKEGNRKWWYIVLSILPVVASVLVASYISKWTYIIYNLAYTTIHIVFSYSIGVQRITIMKKTNHYDDIAEHQAVCETIYCMVRVISYALMLLLGLLLELTGLKILIAIISLCFPFMCVYLIKMEKVEQGYPLETRLVSVEGVVEGKGNTDFSIMVEGANENSTKEQDERK